MDFVVLDLETTGLDCQRDQIIEVGAVRIAHGILCEEFSTLIKPCELIPAAITELTGIDDQMVLGMPIISQVIPQLENFLQGSVIVGHNICFDLGFLKYYISPDYMWLDTLEMAKILLPFESSYGLQDLTASLNIAHTSAHRALGDAKAAAFLFLHLINGLKQLDLVVLETLNRFVQTKKNNFLGDLIREEYTARIRYFPQEAIQSRQLIQMIEKSKGIFPLSASKVIDEKYQIQAREITELFQPGGCVDAAINDFQYRSQQEEMAQGVAAVFNTGGNLVVEAGTGTGKSLAYLLPAILWSTKSGNKVVVSTHTINLQEQLMNNDIPLAHKITGIDFTAAVIKGRNHYLCLKKWDQLSQEKNKDVHSFMMRLVIWLRETATGDINDLTLTKNELREWQNLASNSETCFGAKCRYFRSQCFVSRGRKMAELAQLVIVNHSLLLANAVADDHILPEYKYLVVDEAHHLEKVAEEQFSLEVNHYELLRIFHKLKKGDNQASGGLLEHLLLKAEKWTGLNQDQKNIFIYVIQETNELISECLFSSTEFFNIFSAVFSAEWSENDLYTQTIRILSEHRELEHWQAVCSAGENLRINLTKLIKQLLLIGEKANMVEAEFGMEITESHELNMLSSRLRQLVGGLEIVLQDKEESYVCWVEYMGSKYFPLIHISPVEVRNQLQQVLFAPKTSLILTSATLAVGGKFKYFEESIGLDLSDLPTYSMQLMSPFAYDEKVFLGLASDLPDPGSSPEILFVDRISKSLVKLIRAAKGRTMVLFTSHQQLKQVYDNIALPLKKEGITVYAHGISGNRSNILKGFKNKDNSVILGANSFWEGIDVVGESLTLVVIVKLPFWPPTLPTVSARLDRYKGLHINGFRRYTLPQAIIRFKQGFGRLIRSDSDYGAICILDKRVFQKSYGATFIKSLPKMKTVIGTTDELAQSIQEWLTLKDAT